MRIRDRHLLSKPEVMIIPMIDIMFFLLVFFIMATLYMVNLRTVDINMPQAQNAALKTSATYLVTIKSDGSLWLEDKPIDEHTLMQRALDESRANPNFSVVVRGDRDVDYGRVIALLDKFKGIGITRFGLAAENK